MRHIKAFTLIELLIVITIVGILAAASVPMMRGRIDAAKWAEGKTAAGAIRSAVRAYFVGTGNADGLTGLLSDPGLQAALKFHDSDLTGTYFVPGDYGIIAVNAEGVATVRVTGSQSNAPKGSWTLSADESWSYLPADDGGSNEGDGGNGSSGGNDNINGNGNNGRGRGVPPAAPFK